MLPAKDQVRHIVEAFTYYFIENHWEYFEDDQIEHLLSVVDIERLSDKTICDCSYVRDKVRWNDVPNKKLVRCVARLIDNHEMNFVENNIDLKSKNLKIQDVIHLLRRRPDLLEFLGISIDEIDKQEAHMLLLMGFDYYLDKLDLKKYNFDYMQGFQIAKAYGFQENVVLSVPYKAFNNLQVGELLSVTGEKFVNHLELSVLRTTDWRFILEKQPHMYDYMDPTVLLDSDVFELVKIITMFDYPELHIAMRARVSELTPYGIELLLIHYLEQYEDLVDLSLLDENNVLKIREHHPHFEVPPHIQAMRPKISFDDLLPEK